MKVCLIGSINLRIQAQVSFAAHGSVEYIELVLMYRDDNEMFIN